MRERERERERDGDGLGGHLENSCGLPAAGVDLKPHLVAGEDFGHLVHELVFPPPVRGVHVGDVKCLAVDLGLGMLVTARLADRMEGQLIDATLKGLGTLRLG